MLILPGKVSKMTKTMLLQKERTYFIWIGCTCSKLYGVRVAKQGPVLVRVAITLIINKEKWEKKF